MNIADHSLVTGGAGFIGANLTARLLKRGGRVTVFDNLSRLGARANLDWLEDQAPHGLFTFIRGDLRNAADVTSAMRGVTCIYHMAGQVAVTTSVTDPRADFLDNALGTFNVLEAARLSELAPIIVYSSTNKVYGEMEFVTVLEKDRRYVYESLVHGVPETQPLDFHSPYGCSKGAADQYVHDYARIYGLRTIVFRQSCIYGYRQFGIEDQGWVAWFIIGALKSRPITIYGDGKQVRDILFIDDLLDAYELALENIETTAGQVYNIGGGPENTISIWTEFGPLLEELLGCRVEIQHADWRPGDQRLFVGDVRKAARDFGWHPTVSVRDGISRLFRWIEANQQLFVHV